MNAISPSPPFVKESCCALGVVLGCFVTPWFNFQYALGVILVDWPLLGRFTAASCFLHICIMALTLVY